MDMNLEKNLWPDWETVRLIGQGSFGAVYEIQRNMFGELEKAALKVISIPKNSGEVEEMYNDGYDEESITSTFTAHLKSIVAEYSLMRKMKGCSNIVNCDDVRYVQHEDGIGWDIFIKMELLTPLAKTMPETVPESLVLRVARDLCAALEVCARYNIVHRDIKPHNIFYSENGGYKLGDFGIAKTIERTMGGTKIGTYKYMAPEVFNNRPYGAAADIYSLGLVLYWMLNERRLPFLPLPPEKIRPGMEDDARIRRFGGEPLPPPAHGSEKLKAIVLKACAYDPEDRFASAREMLDALNGYQAGILPAEKPEEEVPDSDVPEEEGDGTATELEKESGAHSDGQDWHEDIQEQDEDDPTIRDEDVKPRKKKEKKKDEPKRKKRWLPLIAAVVVIAVGVLFVLKPWTGWRTIDGKVYFYTSYKDKQTGWAIIDDETYYFDNEGVMKTGWQTLGGEKYWFADNGAMQTGWVKINGEKFYFADDGTLQVRLVTKDGKTCGYNQRGLMLIGWRTLGESKYYFDGEGVIQTGWVTIDGKKRYFDSDGAMLTGWTSNASGETFYFDSDGVMQTGWQTINGYKFYFDSNGVMLTGWTTTSSGETYYFGSDGAMLTGWQTIGEEEFYFDENGVLQD